MAIDLMISARRAECLEVPARNEILIAFLSVAGRAVFCRSTSIISSSVGYTLPRCGNPAMRGTSERPQA
jgi:hypothetical protein